MQRTIEATKRRIRIAYQWSPLIHIILAPAIYARRALFGNMRDQQAKIIDRLGEILSDAPQVRLPQFRGEFFVGARSDIFRRIALGDSYEDYLVRYIEERIDIKRDAIDVGANCGFYTVLLAKLLPDRKVISVEPTNNAVKLLRRNITLNRVSANVFVYEGVATDKEGTANINVIEGREAVPHQVAATTIDQLAGSTGISCGFIKLDVEGHECAVLKGARETLLNHRPVILAELVDPLLRSNGSSAYEMIEFMKGCGYDVVDPRDPTKFADSKFSGDVLCIPRHL